MNGKNINFNDKKIKNTEFHENKKIFILMLIKH